MEKIRDILRRYLHDVSNLPNEAAKTSRFNGLIAELFPGSKVISDYPAGVEKFIRIDISKDVSRRGRIDNYYGNAVIEFEKSLKSTLEDAKRQLREYASGIWQKNGEFQRPLLCIASDGIDWVVFRPRLKENKEIIPKNVELTHLRSLTLTEETLDEFWIWLTTLLYREGIVEPSAERFRVDFGATSLAFVETMEGLRKAWNIAKQNSEAMVCFDTWRRYLINTYGSLSGTGGTTSELEELFLKHTYLASIAKFLIWASISCGKTNKPLRQVADDVLSGRFFQSARIENIVEADFFQWVRHDEPKKLLVSIWERVLSQMQTYDLSRLNQDIFKGIYQELVDPSDRHDLGEYYTPEWLCEKIVSEMLPAEGFVSVIDPACGSGSFMRAIITHLKDANPNVDDAFKLKGILENVVGIDINPLAVTISKATYLLSLGSLVKAAKRPIQIPVYLADSLFLPTEVKQVSLGSIPSFEIRFADKSVLIAEDLVRKPEIFDEAIVSCSKVAIDHAKSNSEDISTLRAYLQNTIAGISEIKEFDAVLPGLWSFTEDLASLIREKNDTIWAFIIRNGYRPAMLRERFDFIIGNPPWLSYRYISDTEYQNEVKKRAVEQYKISPRSKKLFTQMELATLFLVHSIETFGKQTARLAFVMPRSILTADQHEKLRNRTYDAELTIESYWDLQDVYPLFNVPACVVFATKRKAIPSHSYNIPTIDFNGRLPRKDISWEVAQKLIKTKERQSRLIMLGSHSAFSTDPEAKVFSTSARNHYKGRFRQGATIVPRSFYFVRVRNLNGKVDRKSTYWVETDPEQAKAAKAPYKDIRKDGLVEGRFLFYAAISRNVLPFSILELPFVVLPISIEKGRPIILQASQLKAKGYREIAKWMEDAEKVWREKRKGKAVRQDIYQRLNYQSELEAQDLKARHIVLYNTSGTNVSAAHVDRLTTELPLIVDAKLYWASCDSEEEADYLAAVLNSEVINKAIKPFQSKGLAGERDIHKLVLEIPIPPFDKNKITHARLAELGRCAGKKSAKVIKDGELPSSLAKRRAYIRKHLSDILAEINKIISDSLFFSA